MKKSNRLILLLLLLSLITHIHLIGQTTSSDNLLNTSTSDIEAPSAPENLEYTNITGNSITLSWTASKDNVGVKGYQILQNNIVVAEDTSSFTTIGNLLLNTQYSFVVIAFDAEGNYSSASNIVEFTTSLGYNIAPMASLATSYLTSGQSLKAINNNIEPLNSADVSSGAYGNLNGESSYNLLNYVQYKWPVLKSISSVLVYWWDNGAKIKKPTVAYLQYYDYDQWITIDSIHTELNQYNKLNVDITTSSLRLYMKGEFATGVLEWKVIGANGKDRISPTSPSNLKSSNITGVSIDLNWDEASDNNGVTGYQILRDSIVTRTAESNSATVWGLSANSTYTFSVKAYDAYGNLSPVSDTIMATTTGANAEYHWPSYSPTINYNFVDEFGQVPMPLNILDDCNKVAGTLSSDWWCFRWGATKNPLVTEAAIKPMLERFNTDFAYFRDVMGWPPDFRAINGNKCAIYLYGSSLCTDTKPNTEKGGWQSSVYYNGKNWPIVLASYYPVYSYDPACTYTDKEFQKGAMVHEGIHSVLASLPGCQNAAWFHEGGNTWLQQEAESRRSGDYSSMGFLNAAAMIAPFMPIECYSGWLQDGSFGGPSAEGVNMTSGGKQVCTWKNLLGGAQYGNIFPTFMGQALGDGSVPWVWRYCTSRVLEGMGAKLGDAQIRRLICEYRAKQAVLDFGVWTKAITQLLDDNMGKAIQEEWSPYNINVDPWVATPYAVTTNNGSGLLTPAAWTTPGWSGANQIPLKISGNTISVNFQPLGKNMTCQLCYIATDDTRVYSEIVASGDCSLDITKAPINDVVFAVICNTDYKYVNDSTRKAHFDYRLQLGTGITGAASVSTKWYKGYSASLKPIDSKYLPSFDVSKYCSKGHEKLILTGENLIQKEPFAGNIKMYPTPLDKNSSLYFELTENFSSDVFIKIFDTQGRTVYSGIISESNNKINTSGILTQGLYFVTISSMEKSQTYKLMVK